MAANLKIKLKIHPQKISILSCHKVYVNNVHTAIVPTPTKHKSMNQSLASLHARSKSSVTSEFILTEREPLRQSKVDLMIRKDNLHLIQAITWPYLCPVFWATLSAKNLW